MSKNIVLVLRSGGDFSLDDVLLISKHIHGKWEGKEKANIICLYDKASKVYNLGNITFLPLPNDHFGTWSRIALYAPEMEQYRPFLYVDLDTAIITSIENIFDLVKNDSQFITLEDFYQKGQLATALVWFPSNSEKVRGVWQAWKANELRGNRMDYFLRKCVNPDVFWQKITGSISDFKPQSRVLLKDLPQDCDLVCFHGKPRIPQAIDIPWVKNYVNF